MHIARDACCVALLALAALPPVAAATDLRPQVTAFMASPFFQQHKTAALEAQIRRLMPKGCAAELHSGDVAWSHDLQFAADAMPTRGWIRVRYTTRSCNAPRTFNLWAVVRDGVPRLVAGLPGTTHADLPLQADALAYAAAAARTAAFVPAGCTDVHVVDTHFDGATGPVDAHARDAAAPIRETWSYDACGHPGTVAVRFVPDASGVTIKAMAGGPPAASSAFPW